MPAPKAVLRDIYDLALDPTVAHGSVNSTGRLKNTTEAHVEKKIIKEEKKEIKVIQHEDKKVEKTQSQIVDEDIKQEKISLEEDVKTTEGAKLTPSKKSVKKQ